MCLLQWNRSWYASATDHDGTWRWNSFVRYTSHRCSSWTRLFVPVVVQRQVHVVGQSRELWKSRSCNAMIRGRCPCCAGRRLGLVEGATDSVHRQSLWTFQFATSRWAFSEGTAVMLGWAFFGLLQVVPELSASFRSPR